MMNNFSHTNNGGNNEETKQQVNEMFERNTNNEKLDGRDIGDKKPIRETDPKIEKTENEAQDEIIINEFEIETGAIINDEYREEGITVPDGNEIITDLQEKDIGQQERRGEGIDDMPLARKPIQDETDEYQIHGENIEDVPIGSNREGIGIKEEDIGKEPESWENQQRDIGDIRRENERSPTIVYPTI